MSLRLIAGWALLTLAVPAASQGLPPATPDEILAAARSCAAATSSAGLDLKKLEADGWGKASMSADGKPVATPLTFYNKGHLLLAYNSGSAKPFCIFTGRIESAAEFRNLQAAFASSFGAPVKDDGKGEQLFLSPDRHIVDLASTGTADRPAVRVAVGPVVQEAK